MKYAIIIPDGAADEPREELGGRTPLEAAATPGMDAVAAAGCVGLADHVPPGFEPGSDVANMSLLGYDPNQFFSGRAPLEAAAQGIELGPDDWAVRCNLVTIVDQVMREFTAGHIGSPEAASLLSALQAVAEPNCEFIPGVSYRNLMIYRGASAPFGRETRTIPPHDLTDHSVEDAYPRGPGSELLHRLMDRSVEVFADHAVNRARIEADRPPATNVWLWGLGQRPNLTPFAERFGPSGTMISAVDLLHGLAALIGWRRVTPEGATGYLDTNYEGKAAAAIAALADSDLVCVHVEAPDEASHEGRVDAKIEAIEQIDRCIVGPLHDALRGRGDYRLLVTPDHPTMIRTKTHSRGAVPLAVCGAGVTPDAATAYHEAAATDSGLRFAEGWRLMERFTGDWAGPAE